MQIHKVHKAVVEFLEAMFTGESNIISVTKVGQNWEVLVEVYEESSFIKSIGLSTKVMDRNFYRLELDDQLEVISYVREEK